MRVQEEDLKNLLGPVKFIPELAARSWGPGLATGLAWTPAGGAILFVEATRMAGRKGLLLTGQLGDVMKESAQAGIAYLRKHAEEFSLPASFHEKQDLHVHVLEGATPKDGPSAGIAIATAVVSALCGRPVRGDIAMTGEITLRGRVLPIGGVKEKLLAAHQAGIHHVILPADNEANLEDVPDAILQDLEVTPVRDFHEVLNTMLVSDDASDAEFVPPQTEEKPSSGPGARA